MYYLCHLENAFQFLQVSVLPSIKGRYFLSQEGIVKIKREKLYKSGTTVLGTQEIHCVPWVSPFSQMWRRQSVDGTGARMGEPLCHVFVLPTALPEMPHLPPLHFQGSAQAPSYFSNLTLTSFALCSQFEPYSLLLSARTDIHIILLFEQIVGSWKAGAKPYNYVRPFPPSLAP